MVKFIEEAPWKSGIGVWVMDRGMVSEPNVAFLKEDGLQIYSWSICEANLKRFEKQLLVDDWKAIREGLEVKLCPTDAGDEVFILCRSADRRTKEAAMHRAFREAHRRGVSQAQRGVREEEQRRSRGPSERAVGALMKSNSRSARLYDVEVTERDSGGCDIGWEKVEAHRQWSQLSGRLLPVALQRITDWTPEELWKAYIQLTEAEEAFRIQKSDLQLRPIHHQKRERVQAHILVCFLA